MALLQQDLDSAICWEKRNNMSLNDDKFELIQHHASIRNFRSLSELPFVMYDNCYFTSQTTIEPSNYTTDLIHYNTSPERFVTLGQIGLKGRS